MKRWLRNENGSVITEYGLLIVIVAIALIAVLVSFRNVVTKQFHNISSKINSAR